MTVLRKQTLSPENILWIIIICNLKYHLMKRNLYQTFSSAIQKFNLFNTLYLKIYCVADTGLKSGEKILVIEFCCEELENQIRNLSQKPDN